MLIASSDKREIDSIKHLLDSEFEMKHMGEAKKILGMEIKRDRKHNRLFLGHRSYLKKVLQRFDMQEAKSARTPLAQHLVLSASQSPETE